MRRSARSLAVSALTAGLLALAAVGVVPAVASTAPPQSAVGWWTPPQQLTWFWQLQGTIDNSKSVAAYDVDGFETEASEVAALHAQGKHVICYVDVGTAENFRPDYDQFPRSTLGRSNGWPGERWLDIRQTGVLEPIMAARFRMCREKGFDAVEPDNMEAFSNRSGFPITASDQLEYDLWIADEVHSLGMAVLQKNDGEQSTEQQPYFDGALTEQCNQYRECADYQPYLAAGKPVLNAEYAKKNEQFCPADAAAGMMGVRYAKSLNGKKFLPC